jgi:hypothetical protein
MNKDMFEQSPTSSVVKNILVSSSPLSTKRFSNRRLGLIVMGFALTGSLLGGALFIRSKASEQGIEVVIDTISCSQVEGWSYNNLKPNGSDNIAVYYYNTPKADAPITGVSTTANLPRTDVNDARGIIGDHGFKIKAPDNIPTGVELIVEVLLLNDSNNLVSFQSGRIGPCGTGQELEGKADKPKEPSIVEQIKEIITPSTQNTPPIVTTEVVVQTIEQPQDQVDIESELDSSEPRECKSYTGSCNDVLGVSTSNSITNTGVLGQSTSSDKIQKNLQSLSRTATQNTNVLFRGPDSNGYFQLRRSESNPKVYFRWKTDTSRRCGTQQLLGTVVDVLSKFQDKYPDLNIVSGDLNSGHPQIFHRRGIDWDIYFWNKSAGEDHATGNYFLANPEAIELAKILADRGDVETIFYNDPFVQNAVNQYAKREIMKSMPAHTKHFGVQLYSKYAGREIVLPGEDKEMLCSFPNGFKNSYSAKKDSAMKEAGIAAADWPRVDYIVSHESSWFVDAENSSSQSYGLCQANPGNKMSSIAPDFLTNGVTQLKWCDKYAKDAYGSWTKALNHWKANKKW